MGVATSRAPNGRNHILEISKGETPLNKLITISDTIYVIEDGFVNQKY